MTRRVWAQQAGDDLSMWSTTIGCSPAADSDGIDSPRRSVVVPSAWPFALWMVGVVGAVLVVVISRWSVVAGVGFGVAFFGLVVGSFDIVIRRIPDPVVVGTLGAGVGCGVVAGRLPEAALAAGFVGVSVLAVHLIAPEGLGFGDVKYVTGLALLLGAVLSLTMVTMALIAAAVAAAPLAITVPAWRSGAPFGAIWSASAMVALIGTGVS